MSTSDEELPRPESAALPPPRGVVPLRSSSASMPPPPAVPPSLPAVPPSPSILAPPGPREPPPAPEPPAFDARAMVEAQRRRNPNPVYGDLPTGTEEGRRAADELRRVANRKRRRKRTVGRVVAAVVLVLLIVAGYLAYRAFQDEQRRLDGSASPAASVVRSADPCRPG